MAVVLLVVGAIIACGPHEDTPEQVGSSSSAVSTCGTDALTATYPLSGIRDYSGGTGWNGWQIVVPTTLQPSGSWTGVAGATINFTTPAGTVSCAYQQSGTNVTSQPFQFLWCTDLWTGQHDGGPGTILTVSNAQVTANCFRLTCSGNPSVTATWSYVAPAPPAGGCQTVVSCTGGSNGPQQTLQQAPDGTSCTPDACNATATCQAGVCSGNAPLPTDDGNPCTASLLAG